MHLSMKGCVYSQSSQIPTGQITNSRITLVFFLFSYLGQRIKTMELQGPS